MANTQVIAKIAKIIKKSNTTNLNQDCNGFKKSHASLKVEQNKVSLEF